jgi:hypothetical protein
MDDQGPDRVVAVPVERDAIEVMFLRCRDDPAVFGPVWQRLEGLVGLGGRKFFGAFNPSLDEYRVCVQKQAGDDPASLGLESGILPGGRYLRARLQGEPPEIYDRISPAFEALAKAARPDHARPSIEFYRQRNEIDLLLPVATPDP